MIILGVPFTAKQTLGKHVWSVSRYVSRGVVVSSLDTFTLENYKGAFMKWLEHYVVLNSFLFPGVFSGLRNIVARENVWALYKGNGAQMVRIFPYASTQFTSFELYKKVCFYLCSVRHIKCSVILILA